MEKNNKQDAVPLVEIIQEMEEQRVRIIDRVSWNYCDEQLKNKTGKETGRCVDGYVS